MKHTRQDHKNSQDIPSYNRARLCVTKSNKHIYAQIINDFEHKTLCACSTLENKIRSKLKTTSNCNAANIIGHIIAVKSLAKGIENVIFDKGNKPYHGKIKAVAEAARQAGLNF